MSYLQSDPDGQLHGLWRQQLSSVWPAQQQLLTAVLTVHRYSVHLCTQKKQLTTTTDCCKERTLVQCTPLYTNKQVQSSKTLYTWTCIQLSIIQGKT